jgi:hypothetical protein
MPDDINKRMNYFDRQFLRATDFKVEQEYHLHRHRLHNKLLHTPGVASEKDLKVSGDPGTNTLKVAEGIAIDVEGREIVLLKEHPYSIKTETEPGKYELVVRLDEVQSDPSSDPGTDGKTRIEETPIFELLTPNMVKPPMLRLAAIEVEPAGTLKSEPTSIRAFAGTVVGASTTFETVTANTFALRESGIDIAKRPDLSCNTSGDILFRTTRPSNSSPKETLRLTSTGFVKSPMWKVTSIFVNQRAKAIPTPPSTIICEQPADKKLKTEGGILLIFASGSGAAAAGTSGQSITIGMDVLLDDVRVGQVLSCVNDTTESHKPFVTSGLVVPNINPGEYSLKLRTSPSTTVGQNDFFNVTILELPFQ